MVHALLFSAGWWSVATWVAFAVACGVTGIGLLKVRGLGLAGLVLSGPVIAVALGLLLLAFADPDPGCTYDCPGRLVILAVSGAVLIGWAVTLAAVGALYAMKTVLIHRSRTLNQ